MLNIVRVSKFKYCFTGETKEEENVVKDILSCEVDGYIFSPAWKEGLWDGTHKFYSKRREFYHGHLNEVVDELKKKGIEYKIANDQRLNHLSIVHFDERLREHQLSALVAFFKVNYGIVKVPTRGGKTFIASEAIRQVIMKGDSAKVLFFVDGKDLFKQTVTEIAKYLKISEYEIGTINDKGVNLRNINVAMIQSVGSALSSKKNLEKKKILLKFFKAVNFLIVDEVHEYSSMKRLKVLKKLENVDFCMGLSATPYKQSDMIGNLKLKGHFNDICYEIKEVELIEQGVLAENKVLLVMLEHQLSKIDYQYIKDLPGGQKYRALETKLILDNEFRDTILINILKICTELNLKTLVLFNSVKHGKALSHRSGHMFIHGSDDTETRDTEKDKFLEGKGGILFASNIYKKGITLPAVQVMINADGGFEDTTLIQKKGRVLGTTADKTRAFIIDIIDIYKDYFTDHGMNRIRTYEYAVGLDKVDVFEINDSMMDGIKQSLLEWFK